MPCRLYSSILTGHTQAPSDDLTGLQYGQDPFMEQKVKRTSFCGDTERTAHRGPESSSKQVNSCSHCVVRLRMSSSIEMIKEIPFDSICLKKCPGQSSQSLHGTTVFPRSQIPTLRNVCLDPMNRFHEKAANNRPRRVL